MKKHNIKKIIGYLCITPCCLCVLFLLGELLYEGIMGNMESLGIFCGILFFILTIIGVCLLCASYIKEER